MELYSFLLYRASSQGAIFEVPLWRTIWLERHPAACVGVRSIRVCCVQRHRRWNGRLYTRTESSGHDYRLLECTSGKILWVNHVFYYAFNNIIRLHKSLISVCVHILQVVLQLLFIADVSRRRVHLPEQERSKPARQAVTFLLICNVTMWLIYTFEAQKVLANPVSK